MGNQRNIYWVCTRPSPQVNEKVEILRRFHIEVTMIPDLLTLTKVYSQKRLNTILVNDDLIDRNVADSLQKILIRPDYAGVRLILSSNGRSQEFTRLAVALGFRDIIPLDLDPEEWIRRYVFAAAGQPSDLVDPMPQLSLRNIAALHVPARISWISQKELWLETRLVPPVGSLLNLTGGITEMLGLNHLSVKVLEHHQTHLHYRYSDALLCRWDFPRTAQDKQEVLLSFIREQKEAPPHRIYNVVRSQALRKELIKQLDPRHYHLYVALNKTNMVNEPRYISPDAIVIEDVMCLGPNRAAFKEMLDQLPRPIPIFVIGSQVHAETFRELLHKFSITTLPALPASFGSFLTEKVGPPYVLREGATFVAKNHQLSYAQVVIPARLTAIHPRAVQLALHFPLGRFGICALESSPFTQVLGRKVHIKVIQGRQKLETGIEDFPFHINGLIVDLQKQERLNLAQYLITYFQQKLFPAYKQEKAASSVPKNSPLPPEEIEIDPSAEDPDTYSAVDKAVAGLERFNKIFSREWKIAILTLVIFGIFFALILKYRTPESEQGKIYSDQLRLFKEMHSAPRRGSSNQP